MTSCVGIVLAVEWEEHFQRLMKEDEYSILYTKLKFQYVVVYTVQNILRGHGHFTFHLENQVGGYLLRVPGSATIPINAYSRSSHSREHLQ